MNLTFFHPYILYSVQISKCSGSCNNINDPFAKMCFPDVVKHINIKVFNLILRTNETRHETCKLVTFMKLVNINEN